MDDKQKMDFNHSIPSAHLFDAEGRYGRLEVVQKITLKQLAGGVLLLLTVGFAVGMIFVLTNPTLKNEARLFGVILSASFLFPLRASWCMMLGK